MASSKPVTRLGLQIPSFSFPGVPDAQLFEKISSIVSTAEASGFDSIWVMDHFYQISMIGKPEEPMLEAYSLLAALAARTKKVRLGTMVTGVTYRNPALLAKTLTTLDVISSGRAILGVGAAWNDMEHAGYGFGFPSTRERMDRLEEALQVVRLMFAEESPSFEGRYYRIDHALNNPRPITPGGPPILIGGSGEKRTLKLVAKYGDACNIFGDLATVKAKMEVLDRHCHDIGRNPAEVTRTKLGSLVIAPTSQEAARLGAQMREARGVDEAYYRASVIEGTPDRVAEQVQEFIDAGLDGMIFSMHPVYDEESVALAGETLSKALG